MVSSVGDRVVTPLWLGSTALNHDVNISSIVQPQSEPEELKQCGKETFTCFGKSRQSQVAISPEHESMFISARQSVLNIPKGVCDLSSGDTITACVIRMLDPKSIDIPLHPSGKAAPQVCSTAKLCTQQTKAGLFSSSGQGCNSISSLEKLRSRGIDVLANFNTTPISARDNKSLTLANIRELGKDVLADMSQNVDIRNKRGLASATMKRSRAVAQDKREKYAAPGSEMIVEASLAWLKPTMDIDMANIADKREQFIDDYANLQASCKARLVSSDSPLKISLQDVASVPVDGCSWSSPRKIVIA